MDFEIKYHKLVVSEDIPKISSADRIRIKKSIEKKLSVHPEIYGKPLRKSLKGYRKLRVGDYRVIFRIEDKTVKIMIIKHRSIIYRKSENRVEE